MNIVYLYDNFPAYRRDFFSLLNKKLEDKGHSFDLIYLESNRESIQNKRTDVDFSATPCQEGLVGFGKLFQLKYFKSFKKLFKSKKPDVVVLQFHTAVLTYWWMLLYVKTHKIPYVIWECGYTRDTLKSWLVKFRKALVDKTYKMASVCICYGTRLRDYIVKIGKNPKDVIVAQNTINVEKLIENRSTTCANRDYNHPIHFLYVGALIHRKFVMPALEAITELINDGADIYFDIVGKGEEYDALKSYIISHNMENRIILHGAKHGNEVKPFFENCDVFLLPGTGGLAINEAMAYSMPIISTIGDDTVPDLIDGNGYLLKNFGDKDEIRKAMADFIALSNEEKQKMGNRSEEILMAKATLNNMTNQHIVAVERAIEKRNNKS